MDFNIKNAPVLAKLLDFEAVSAICYAILYSGGEISVGIRGLKIIDMHGEQLLLAVTAHLTVGVIDFQQLT